jgi:predicted nucleic acid-binding protein
MALVIDSSIALSWFFPDERTGFTEAALTLAGQEECWVPAVWRLEFPNALLVAERRRRRVDATVHDVRQISHLASQAGLTTYDATYLELAHRLAAPLITLDRDLAAAATQLGVAVHAPGRNSTAQLRERYNV